MSYLLVHLTNKDEIDYVLTQTVDKLVVLRFGRDDEHNTMIVDHMVSINQINRLNRITI